MAATQAQAKPLTETVVRVRKEIQGLESTVAEERRCLAIEEARRHLGNGRRLSIEAYQGRLEAAEKKLAHMRIVLDGLLILQERGEFPTAP